MRNVTPKSLSKLTYREAIELVALNESPGDDEAFDLEHVSRLIGVVLVADVYGVKPEVFAKAVIRYRKKVV